MPTTIHSNGSKWNGQDPDDLDTLLKVLESHPLRACSIRPDFEEVVRLGVLFTGNFATVSHVFRIVTDDQVVIDKLRAAIAANRATPAYQTYNPKRIHHAESDFAARQESGLQEDH